MHDLIYFLIFLLITPYYLIKSVFVPKYRAGLMEKFGFLSRAKGLDAPTVWFHCVSVGETLAMTELIQAARAAHPELKIAVSTTTQTGMKVAREKDIADTYFYYPFDFSCIVRRFLKIIKPRMLVLAELEVWPNMIRLAAKRGIPVAVVNGRITVKSHKQFQRWGFLTRKSFRNLSFTAVQDEVYRDCFIDSGTDPETTLVTGNMKYDSLREEVDQDKMEELGKCLQIEADDRLLIGGSTHEGEEKLLLSAFNQLKEDFPALRLILVPRHPERLESVKKDVTTAGLEYYLRTALTGDEEDLRERVVIIDTMGELAVLYKLAAIAFVGGSFSGTGGHNMMEPAIFRKPVIVGPSTFNFAKDMARLREGDAVREAADGESLTDSIRTLLEEPAEAAKLGERGHAVVQNFKGALARNLELIEKHLR